MKKVIFILLLTALAVNARAQKVFYGADSAEKRNSALRTAIPSSQVITSGSPFRIAVTLGDGAKFAGIPKPFILTVAPSFETLQTAIEEFICSAVSHDTLTLVQRHLSNTLAATWPIGSYVGYRISALQLKQLADTFNAYITAGPGSGTVTSVTALSPLTMNRVAGGTGTTVDTVAIPPASGSQSGYLSSANWTTFNNKQAALSATSPLVLSGTTLSMPVATSSQSGYLLNTDWLNFNNKFSLPDTTGSTNDVLTVTSSGVAWSSVGSGSVTSVDVSGGLTGMTFINGPVTHFGTITMGGTLNIANGGTGASTAYQGLLNLLPSTTGRIGEVLRVSTIDSSVVWDTISGAGTVTSVAVTGGSTGLTTSGGPITGSGTIALGGTLNVASGGTGVSTTSQNFVFAGPTSGSGAPAFRALVAADIPNISAAKITSGILPIAQGGTNAATANAALNNLLPTQTGDSGLFLMTDGTSASWQAAGSGGGGSGTGKSELSSGVLDNGQLTKNSYYPFSGGSETNHNATPSYAHGNITRLQFSGTLKNLSAYFMATATVPDSFVVYRSTDNGITFTATALMAITSTGHTANDLTHSVAVNAGDYISLFVTNGSSDIIGTNGGWFLEYDNPTGGGGGSGIDSLAMSGGSTGLSFSPDPLLANGTITTSGILTAAHGGTGTDGSAFDAHSFIYWNGTAYADVVPVAPSVLQYDNSGLPFTGQVGLSVSDGLVNDILEGVNGGTGNNIYATGDILYYNGGSNENLARRTIGTAGQVLTVSGGVPVWATPGTGGTVTSVSGSGGSTGLTLTGGPITTSGTLTLGGILATTNGGTGINAANRTALEDSLGISNDTLFGLYVMRYPSLSTQNTIQASDTTAVDLTLRQPVGGSEPLLNYVNSDWSASHIIINNTGIVQVAAGGTNIASYTTGDLLYASGSGVLSKLGIGSSNKVLTVSGGLPTWQTPTGVTSVSGSGGTTGLTLTGGPITTTGTLTLGGTLVVANGGTGDASVTAYAPIIGGTTSTGALQSASTGMSNAGYVLTSTGTSSAPTWQASAAASYAHYQALVGTEPGPPSGDGNVYMMGLGAAITPVSTGRVEIIISGEMPFEGGSYSPGCNLQIYYGTGAAPVNGVGPVGTAASNNPLGEFFSFSFGAAAYYYFSVQVIVSGLTPMTAYWIDLGAAAQGGGNGIYSIQNFSISAKEIP